MLKLGKLSVGHEGNATVSFSSDGNESTKGGTTYTINRWGKIVSSIGCNGDSCDVVMVGSSSYRCETSLSIEDYSYGYGQKGTQIKNGDYGLFKFLADNTDVEWGAMYSGGLNPSDSTSCLLQTSHNNGECHVSFCWSDFDTFVHSHPEDGRQNATESDEEMKKERLGKSQNKVTNFGVYLTKSRTVISF